MILILTAIPLAVGIGFGAKWLIKKFQKENEATQSTKLKSKIVSNKPPRNNIPRASIFMKRASLKKLLRN